VVTKPLNDRRLRRPFRSVDRDARPTAVEWPEPALPSPEEDTRRKRQPYEDTPPLSGPAWRVLFQVDDGRTSSVGLDVWRVTVLGRADPFSAFRPDLDFSSYGGMRYGVSRRHALVRPGEYGLYLIDQNSTNGTWVNGQRLSPGRDFLLTDGDVIELGALRMTLRIIQAPADAQVPRRRSKGRWW
jgi:hypothetical protein